MKTSGTIRTGMGGWSYDPWRETFYPPDVTRKGELAYASRQVTAIEINSTFYRLQTKEIFEGWRDTTPDGFMFTTKATRTTTHRKDLTEARESVERFTKGVAALAPKLGAINWQLEPHKKFEAKEIEEFLGFLPREMRGTRLRHALEVRHDSFKCAQFVDLARAANVAVVFADTDEHPSFADVTADFIYGRLMKTVSSEPTGYTKKALAKWADRASAWAKGGEPDDLTKATAAKPPARPRDVFLFFISGAKERAPLAAMQLAQELKGDRSTSRK